jgi:hypothetical protein
LWRREPHRLEAEIIRDAQLVASQLLDTRVFGPGTLDESSRRRSIYFTVKRSKLVPTMQVFDAPEALGSVGNRPTTTIAPQALLLMNNPEVRNYAKAFARRIAPTSNVSLEQAVTSAYLIAFTRPPTEQELANSEAFLQQQCASYELHGRPNGRALALADYCQTLMCLNEFVYVD